MEGWLIFAILLHLFNLTTNTNPSVRLFFVSLKLCKYLIHTHNRYYNNTISLSSPKLLIKLITLVSLSETFNQYYVRLMIQVKPWSRVYNTWLVVYLCLKSRTVGSRLGVFHLLNYEVGLPYKCRRENNLSSVLLQITPYCLKGFFY